MEMVPNTKIQQLVHQAVNTVKNLCGVKNYLFLLSICVGIIAGLAAVILRTFADVCHSLIQGRLEGGDLWTAFVLPAVPAIGIFGVILFVRFWIRGPYEKSLSGVITSTANGTGDLPKQKTYSHILTSGFCVGMGASAGLEAPIALTGSALGANLAKLLHLNRENRILLLACGGAAGISAVFHSPVAGALFACEILLPEFSIPALIPLLMSSATAAVVAQLLAGHETFQIEVTGWYVRNIPFYVIMGILAGLTAAFVIRASSRISRIAENYRNVWLKGLAGSAILYLMFLLFPALRGEGYRFINALLTGNAMTLSDGSPIGFLFHTPWTLLMLVGALIFLKALVSSISIESGGDGGIFAPSMFIGGFLGYFCIRLFKLLSYPGVQNTAESNFIAVGMGGVLAGVMHAPMTGIFLIAELTGGYKLFIPLMIVASISYFVCRKLSPYNVYKTMIVQHGGSPEPAQEMAMMTNTPVSELVERDFTVLRQEQTLRSLLAAIMNSKRNIFPVVDENDQLVGIVSLDDVRAVLLDSQLYDMALVYDVMTEPGPILKTTDSLADAARLFERAKRWNIAVADDGRYVGFVSKSGIFERYRSMLKNKPELF